MKLNIDNVDKMKIRYQTVLFIESEGFYYAVYNRING